MGYYTQYSLTMPRNPITALQLEAAIMADEVALIALGVEGSSSGETAKWYEHDTFMLTLSAKYPNTIFKLHGDGEESGDLWDKYYVGGKLQHEERLKTELPIPDFDKMAPLPDFAARKLRISQLIGDTQAGENFDIPDKPGCYLMVEYVMDDPIHAEDADTIPNITAKINESDTQRDSVTVFDLDTGEEFTASFAVTAYHSNRSRMIDVNGIDL
jgi:hypothetical protein